MNNGWIRLAWDRVGAWLCIAGGGLAFIVGWFGLSGSAYPAEQIPYLMSGGIGAVFLAALGAMLWLSADLRDEWTKLDRIEEALRDLEVADTAPVQPETPRPRPGSRRQRPLSADGTE